MSNRKRPEKPLEINWLAKPYEATWAFAPEEVPVWDSSRGLPLDIPDTKVHFYDDEDEVKDVPSDEWTFDRADPFTDIDYLSRMMGHRSWEISPPPKSGYPRLVRKNYTAPIVWRECGGVEIINLLVRLLRDEPNTPSKWVMNDIVKLDALVGPVEAHNRDTLEAWLNLARFVKAHLKARRSLYLFGFDKMYSDVEHWARRDPKLTPLKGQHNKNLPTELDTSALFAIFFTYGFFVRNEKTPQRKQKLFMERNENDLRQQANPVEVLGRSLYTRVTLKNWVKYKLADVWKPGVKVLDCKGCNQPFYTTREGKSYCTPACRVLRRNREVAAEAKAP